MRLVLFSKFWKSVPPNNIIAFKISYGAGAELVESIEMSSLALFPPGQRPARWGRKTSFQNQADHAQQAFRRDPLCSCAASRSPGPGVPLVLVLQAASPPYDWINPLLPPLLASEF